EEVVDGLRRLGAFGIKIPKEYGGLGFSVSEYTTVMQMVGSSDNNISALLSAHQSIGVPQPLKLFGTPEQKKTYLPRCAAGAISAFALTEPHVGSDPASLSTTAERDGDDFVLNGEKLWCTNGTLAELLVVMARDPKTKKISAFIVETAWPGVKVEYRCGFMGLKALANGVVSFRDVRVPRENLIGEEGRGLKIALVTLNTGRLTLPAACAGIAKQCLEICRRWSNARYQWGVPIWKHEAIGHEIAGMAATVFAMDSVAKLASRMADRGGRKLARESFHGMIVYQARMERKQGFPFRCVDIVMELFAMAASVRHARRLRGDGHAEAGGAAPLADLFCRQSRRKVRRLFRDLWSNEDARKNQLAASVMKGDQVWLEEGRLDLGFGPDAFKTRSITRAVAPEPERRRATPS